jgi:protein arginine kinase activator
MRCERCGKRDATVHFTQVEGEEVVQRHLCDACAAELNIPVDPGSSATGPLATFLAQLEAGRETRGSEACLGCGLRLVDLRRSGRVGCAECYDHFGEHLRPLLRKLHGSLQHVGKHPPDSPASELDRTARLLYLRRDLERSIANEDFERAAALRDQIRRLEAEQTP